jgi:hypothetical protein
VIELGGRTRVFAQRVLHVIDEAVANRVRVQREFVDGDVVLGRIGHTALLPILFASSKDSLGGSLSSSERLEIRSQISNPSGRNARET